jgi:hypothetical protein
MARESIQHKLDRVRSPRVVITYDVEIGDAIEMKELPFVVGALARLYPCRRHRRGSPASGAAVRWAFPPGRGSRVTCNNGSRSTRAGVPRRSHPHTGAGLGATMPLAGVAARALAPVGPPPG